jgi:hypothetical protein
MPIASKKLGLFYPTTHADPELGAKGVEMSRVTGGLFLSASLLAFLVGPPAAKANTFVVNDLSETLTTLSGLGPSPLACRLEGCIFDISPPAGAISVDTFATVFISDPGGITISDQIVAGVITTVPPTVIVEFNSDTTESSGGPCAFITGGCLTETGEVQTAGTITWVDIHDVPIRTDTIEFSSVLTSTPFLNLPRGCWF